MAGKTISPLKWTIRAAGVVHAMKPAGRTNGRNGYLWTLTTADHTLFHVIARGGEGDRWTCWAKPLDRNGQTLVSDFYSVTTSSTARSRMPGALLRELRDSIANGPELTGTGFFVRCKRLIQAC